MTHFDTTWNIVNTTTDRLELDSLTIKNYINSDINWRVVCVNVAGYS
jgi:hypothetical protein